MTVNHITFLQNYCWLEKFEQFYICEIVTTKLPTKRFKKSQNPNYELDLDSKLKIKQLVISKSVLRRINISSVENKKNLLVQKIKIKD